MYFYLSLGLLSLHNEICRRKIFAHEKFTNHFSEVRVTSLISSDHQREQIRRRLAVEERDLSTSVGEIGSDDGEDSPLQSKRSSMLIELIT